MPTIEYLVVPANSQVYFLAKYFLREYQSQVEVPIGEPPANIPRPPFPIIYPPTRRGPGLPPGGERWRRAPWEPYKTPGIGEPQPDDDESDPAQNNKSSTLASIYQ